MSKDFRGASGQEQSCELSRIKSPTALASPVLVMTSFATELATPSVTDVRYIRTDTLPRVIYKDLKPIKVDDKQRLKRRTHKTNAS